MAFINKRKSSSKREDSRQTQLVWRNWRRSRWRSLEAPQGAGKGLNCHAKNKGRSSSCYKPFSLDREHPRAAFHQLRAVIFPFIKALRAILPIASTNPSRGRPSIMENLALNSAEELKNLRAITGTVEVPTKRDNDAALALGARPI